MPTKCSVKGCDTFYEKGKPFFNLPTESKYKYAWEKAELAKKRRKLWLEAMGLLDDESTNMLRICTKHFLSGKPSALENSTDIDWVPSFNMNLAGSSTRQQKQIREQDKDKRRPSNHSASSHHSSSSRHFSSSQGSSSSKRSTSLQKNTKHHARRSDSKKFLNGKVLLDGTLDCPTFNGTNGSGLAILQKHGSFTSDNVTLKETAINNTILRIHLIREDLTDLKREYRLVTTLDSNKRKRKRQQVSSFGRQIKRKRYFYDFDGASSQFIRKIPNSMEGSAGKLNVGKTINTPMNRSENEERKHSMHGKSATIDYSFENNKTLSKTKNVAKDKIKVKFFPKTSPSTKTVLNGTIDEVKEGQPLQLRREILFVKQYKNDHVNSNKEQKYYLKFPHYRYHDDGKLNYAFQKLVTDVKHMKLPAPGWKIKVIIRQGKISAITFTNKLELERCVGFFVNSNRYQITIDNKPALLLGSPNTVSDASELEILLDIVQNIDSDNPMIFYK